MKRMRSTGLQMSAGKCCFRVRPFAHPFSVAAITLCCQPAPAYTLVSALPRLCLRSAVEWKDQMSTPIAASSFSGEAVQAKCNPESSSIGADRLERFADGPYRQYAV